MNPQTFMHELARPFDAEDIKWRVGHTSGDKQTGLALAYLDARAAEDRLDEVCGAYWRCTYPTVVRSSVEGRRGSVVVCSIAIKVGDEWIERCNGAGDTAVEAEKGALSDAFKRAATLWGVGRYLYGFPSPWVKVNPMGKSFAIDKGERPKLARLSAEALAAYNANPTGFRAPPIDEPPAAATFAQVAPPERPQPPARPAEAPPSSPAGPMVAALQAARELPVAVGVVLHARKTLTGGELAAFDDAYTALLCRWLGTYATERQPEAIEALAQALAVRGQGPAKADAPKVQAAFVKARREALPQ